MVCIPVLCLFLLFYQKCGGNFAELTADAAENKELLAYYADRTPEEIAQELSGLPMTTKSMQSVLEQAKYLQTYPQYLQRVQKQAASMQATTIFGGDPNSFTYRNIVKTAEDFRQCSAAGIRLGNDRAIRDWLAFSFADWAYLAAIILLIMAFLDERKKGLAAIIRTCPAGRLRLQSSRLLVLLGYCAGMTALIYYLPLGISLAVDGGWADLSRPVQSMAAFQRCTVQMTFFAFLGRYFVLKTLSGFLLGVLLWFLLSFVEQVQLCWMLTAVGLGVEYLCYTLIPAQSVFSILRSVNVFSYVFSEPLYTQYENINFFTHPVSQRALLLTLLAVLLAVLSTALLWTLIRRYPFGNRDLLGRWLLWWNRAGDAVRRHLGWYGLEWYKLVFLSAGGLFLILGLLLTRNIWCASGAYNRMEDGIYRQYVAEIQGPVTQSTYDYIAKAKKSLEQMHGNTGDYAEAIERLERRISQLGDGDYLVDEIGFLNIYGSKAWYVQRQNGMLAMIFLASCLSTLFACEQNGDVKKILHATPGGRSKLFGMKYAVALGVTALVWLLVFGQEWQKAAKLLGPFILSAPCGSIEILKGFPMTVGAFLVLLYVLKGVALLLTMHLCIFLAERSKSFELAFVAECAFLMLPAVVYGLGVDALRIATPLSLLADGVAIFSAGGFALLAAWTALSLLALFAARRHWCRSQ